MSCLKLIKIYVLTNKINGKQYVGFSHDPYKRFEHHCKSKYHIGNAIRHYGSENFSIEILDETYESRILAGARESALIVELNSREPNGYNYTAGGDGFDSETARKNADERVKNNTHNFQGPENRRLFWENLTDDEYEAICANMSKSAQERVSDPEWISPFKGGEIQKEIWAKKTAEERSEIWKVRATKRYLDPEQRRLAKELAKKRQLASAAARKGKKNKVNNPKKCGKCGLTGHYTTTCKFKTS